jgi:hypothetical protein
MAACSGLLPSGETLRVFTRLREDLAEAERRRREVERERDRLKRQNERLKEQLDAARRAGFRQAAPFRKDRPQGHGGRPGRRAGAAYGRRAQRPTPSRVDETFTAPLPSACPDRGGTIQQTRIAAQYQEDLPVVRPIVRRFDVHIGCCTQCGRRVQGRHPLQTSDALGAAHVRLLSTASHKYGNVFCLPVSASAVYPEAPGGPGSCRGTAHTSLPSRARNERCWKNVRANIRCHTFRLFGRT